MTTIGASADAYVIVGAGLAGAKAAETLRREGFPGRVLLVGAEPDPPYDRPPLSKGFLDSSADRASIDLHPRGWYDDQQVELLLGTHATGLDTASHELMLDTGRPVTYSKLLLATGASPRRLDIPGADLGGVHYLRDVADAESLRDAIAAGGKRVVVIGGGWIGLEAAAAAGGYGNVVTLIEHQSAPLHAVLGQELGMVFGRLHQEHGVDLRLRTGVVKLCGAAGGVTGVCTDQGDVLPADVVIVGVGVRPNTALATQAGLVIDNGIVVDEALRTSAPDVYAAGDVANAFNPLLGRHLRVEHWQNARRSGPAAARSMLGRPVSYDPVPYFYTDQYDLSMEFTGYVGPGDFDRIVYRGDPDSRRFLAFWLAQDRVVAGMNVNIWDVAKPIEHLIRSRAHVDDQRLQDASIPIDDVQQSAAPRERGAA